MKVTSRKLINRFNKNYIFLYEMSNSKMIHKTIEHFCNVFFEQIESGNEEFKSTYEIFCQKRNDACTSDREIAAYMILYNELIKE